jgi:hypothetical protein
MNTYYKKHVTVDTIQLYLTKDVILMPGLYDHFLECLKHMERHGQVSLVPITILQTFHRKLEIAA